LVFPHLVHSRLTMNKIRDLLAEGLLLALPLGAAAYLFFKVIGLLSKLLIPATHLLPNGRWFGIAAVEIAALLVLLVALVALGAFSRSKLGRRIAKVIEDTVLSKVPFYLIIKNIVADVTNTESATDLQPALVSFDDNAVLGFIVEESDDKSMYTVFIPSSPSAATGSVTLMPKSRVQLLDAPTMTAMRAMKQRGFGLQALTKAKD
jgi:uncharacterized membrane protein